MINKATCNYKYKLSQKALSTLSIYKIVIRLKSQVLSKEDCRLVADRQTDMQSDFVAWAQSPWNTGQTRSPPELPGWSQVTTIFSLCWPIWIVLTWGRLCLKKLCFKPRKDVSYIGHWPMTIYLSDRQTDRHTDRYMLPFSSSQKSYHCLLMDCRTVLKIYVSSLTLPVNEL